MKNENINEQIGTLIERGGSLLLARRLFRIDVIDYLQEVCSIDKSLRKVTITIKRLYEIVTHKIANKRFREAVKTILQELRSLLVIVHNKINNLIIDSVSILITILIVLAILVSAYTVLFSHVLGEIPFLEQHPVFLYVAYLLDAFAITCHILGFHILAIRSHIKNIIFTLI